MSIIKRGERCPTCGRYVSRDLVTSGLVIKSGKILLVNRNIEPCRGMWSLIGGYIGWDETVEDCAKREVKEEVGLECEIINFLGIYSGPNRDTHDLQNIGLAYVLKPVSEKILIQKEEVMEAKWFTFDNLPTPLAFDHAKIIEDYKKSLHS